MTRRPGARPPELHVIAGSNGSGKSTLYERELRHRLVGLPFVNADILAHNAFGHAAVTLAEAQEGQRLAEEEREKLMAARQSYLAETTFSHISKVELVERAKALGYSVTIYQVGLRTADLAVERVRQRVAKGGHPVPEDRTRARWARSQPLIREAVRLADFGYVYDNSRQDEPHRMALILQRGRLAHVAAGAVPEWVRRLYAEELRDYAPQDLNPGAHSFAMARVIAGAMLGDDARVFAANPHGSYVGDVLGMTALHTVHHIGPDRAVAHFTNRLTPTPVADTHVRITYHGDEGRADVEMVPRDATPMQAASNQAAVAAFRDAEPRAALQAHPELKDAYALVRAFAVYLDVSGCPATPALTAAFHSRVARAIEEGAPLPAVGIAVKDDPEKGQGMGR